MARRSDAQPIHRTRRLLIAWAGAVLVIGLGVLAIGLASCSSDMGLPPPMTVVNRTDGAVEVTIFGQVEDFEELPKVLPGGGGSMLLGGPFQAGDMPCLKGGLVATRHGQTVATIDKPCAGSRWEIKEAAPTS